jgi:uncharacterized protein YcnI
MKKNLLFATLVVLVPSLAMAHVSVRPRASKPGVEEQYTVRVPTEGSVATTHVVLDIPADVTVLEVLPAEGATFETAKQGDRITSITWRKAIPPKASAEFAFRARNPPRKSPGRRISISAMARSRIGSAPLGPTGRRRSRS